MFKSHFFLVSHEQLALALELQQKAPYPSNLSSTVPPTLTWFGRGMLVL